MEIQFSNSPHQELATKIKSKGLLNFFVSFKGNGSTKAHAKQTSYQFQYQKKKKARSTTIVFMLNKLPISFNIKRKRRQDQPLLFLKIKKLSRISPNLLEKNKQISFQFSPITYKILLIPLPL